MTAHNFRMLLLLSLFCFFYEISALPTNSGNALDSSDFEGTGKDTNDTASGECINRIRHFLITEIN